MENSKKSNFLVTWGSIMLLLVLVCALGVSNTVKGTKAVYTCPNGGTVEGDNCVGKVITATSSNGCLDAGMWGSCNDEDGDGEYSCSCSYKATWVNDSSGDGTGSDLTGEERCTSGSACFNVGGDYKWLPASTYCTYNATENSCSCTYGIVPKDQSECTSSGDDTGNSGDDTGNSGDNSGIDNIDLLRSACLEQKSCFYVAEDYVWTSKDTYCNFNESTGACTCRPTPDTDKDEGTCKSLGATEPDDTDKDDNDNVTESEAACISGDACFWAAEDYLWTSREQMNCKYNESNNTCSCKQPVVPGIIEAQYCNEYSATCAPGTYYEGPDSNGGNMCVECPAGYYCPGGTFNPNSDSYGKYSCMAYNGGTSKAGSSSTTDCKNPCEGENSFLTSLAPSFAPIYCERQGFDFYRITNLGGNPACSTIECCNCEGEECDEPYYACWCDDSTCDWGNHTESEGYVKDDDGSSCPPSVPPSEPPSNPPSSNPSTPSGSSPSNPSSSKPSTSKPSTSNPSTSTPSGSTSKDNVGENPKTADVLMYVVWIAGLVSIGYSVWYFKNTRKVN